MMIGQTSPDKGQGGKYLVLGPNSENIQAEGYFVKRSPTGDGPVLRFAACAKPARPRLAAAPAHSLAVQNASARSEGFRDGFWERSEREGYPGWLSPPAEGQSRERVWPKGVWERGAG